MKSVENYWGRTAKEEREFEDKHEKILKIFSKYKFKRILDVGCGDGNFSLLLKNACKADEVCGVDRSEEAVKLTSKNGVHTFKLDTDRGVFPFESNYFDAVFAGEVIEHLFDPDHLLDEVYRVLKSQGTFVLNTPNLAAIHNRIALLFGFQPFPMSASLKYNVGRAFEPRREAQSLDHVRVLTLRSLKQLLKLHNLKIVEVIGACAILPKEMRFLSAIHAVDKFFSLFPSLSYRVIVIGSKT